MTNSPCRFAMMLALSLAFALPAWAGQAPGYPARVIRYVIPGGAGAGTDIIGRIIAAGLTQGLGQQVIVDNRPGAGGNIGAELGAKAAPDGYTILQISITHAVNVTLYRSLRYDIVRDFAAITQLASAPAIIVIHPSLPARSISEFVKLAKAKPGVINYASAGTGTPTFLAAELFKSAAAIDLVHVPYKGGAEAQTATIAGETSVYFASFATALPFVRQGRLRALAVTTAEPTPLIPGLPTMVSSGVPGYEIQSTLAAFVPAKTPDPVVKRLNEEIVRTLAEPGARQKFFDISSEPVPGTPAQLASLARAEANRLGKIIVDAGIHD